MDPSFDDCFAGSVKEIAERVHSAPGPVAIVGQSRAGVVISEVAERVPERIGYLVCAAAFLLADGKSLASILKKGHPHAAPIFTVDTPDMTAVLPDPSTAIYSPRVFGRDRA